MGIDRLVNWVLAIFGSTGGERRAWFHSQNLVEGSWPYRGRCWLRLGKEFRLRFSWDLWGRFCGFSLGLDPSERALQWHIALPPLSFWWGVEGLGGRALWRRLFEGRILAWWDRWLGGSGVSVKWSEFSLVRVAVHNWALWWSFLKPEWGWSSKMPWWVDGSLHPGRVLGQYTYRTETLEERQVLVPMPEGPYPAQAELRVGIRGRRLWPFKHRVRECELTLKQGIPVPGKGENSWDCGDDAVHGLSTLADSIEEAVGKLVGSVLATRHKRGAPARWPTPPRTIVGVDFGHADSTAVVIVDASGRVQGDGE